MVQRHVESECLVPIPFHALKAANRRISEGIKSCWAHVNIGDITSYASVRYHQSHALALIVSGDHPFTDRVVIRVTAVIPREGVKQEV